MGLTGFGFGLTGFSMGFTGFHWVSLGFHWVFMGFPGFPGRCQRVSGSYWLRLGNKVFLFCFFLGFDWVFIGSWRVQVGQKWAWKDGRQCSTAWGRRWPNRAARSVCCRKKRSASSLASRKPLTTWYAALIFFRFVFVPQFRNARRHDENRASFYFSLSLSFSSGPWGNNTTTTLVRRNNKRPHAVNKKKTQ